MPEKLPPITGKQLIRLLKKGGWVLGRRTRHGRSLTKTLANGRKLVTVIPDKNSPLPPATLSAIVGPLQARLGRDGLERLIQEFGL